MGVKMEATPAPALQLPSSEPPAPAPVPHRVETVVVSAPLPGSPASSLTLLLRLSAQKRLPRPSAASPRGVENSAPEPTPLLKPLTAALPARVTTARAAPGATARMAWPSLTYSHPVPGSRAQSMGPTHSESAAEGASTATPTTPGVPARVDTRPLARLSVRSTPLWRSHTYSSPPPLASSAQPVGPLKSAPPVPWPSAHPATMGTPAIVATALGA